MLELYGKEVSTFAVIQVPSDRVEEALMYLQDKGCHWNSGESVSLLSGASRAFLGSAQMGLYMYLKIRDKGAITWSNTPIVLRGLGAERNGIRIEMPPLLTNEGIFKIFLKKHRKYSSFKRGCSDLIFETEVTNAINGALHWSSTEEGSGYWAEMNGKWVLLCHDLKLTGDIDLREVVK